ncbi:MAG: RNA pseudouridine synthase, partial [Muribaculaceae bacterium]|nr:RNA pseudouridine synthase [Muribaculaceae bacterium]
PAQGELHHWITTVEKTNKSTAHSHQTAGAKEARLRYRTLATGERFTLVEVELLTGRKHQIRVQLSAIGSTIRGDLKYGDKRSNPDGSISLLARRISFTHPVSKKAIELEAPVPDERLWTELEAAAMNSVNIRHD